MRNKKQMKTLLKIASLLVVSGIGVYAMSKIPDKKASAQTYYNTNSTSTFIASIAPTASQIGQEYDLYASVLIAQAVLESSSGQSGLAQAPNYNLFGIKGSYNGASVNLETQEDDGYGNLSTVTAAFRSYPSYVESMYDYANLLSSSTYAGTWKSNTSSYQDATAALTGLYATDSSYASKLNQIIATYGLTAYDTMGTSTGNYEASSSGYVWNTYRNSYTDQETLNNDKEWASYSGN